jgi:predicted NAD/FAD-binding protein
MTRRIAVVGSGISGLVAAYLLHRKHDVHVFEANDYVGGHSHTLEVDTANGPVSVDTGFIVYNEQNYPNFSRLLRLLDVATQPSTMSFSVRMDHPELEYNGSTVRQLFAQPANLVRPRFYRMLTDILRFNRQAPVAVRNGAGMSTLGEYVRSAGYSDAFVHHYLVPMGSAIWSSPASRVLEMPAAFFVRFFENHGMLQINDRPQWRTITGGSVRYVERLTREFRDRIRLRTPVSRVRRLSDGVLVDGERFDHVVIGCHSDQALQLLEDPTDEELTVLGAIRYQPNQVVLHSDSSVLPRRRSAWAAWNYHVRSGIDSPAAVTYNMNMLQSLTSADTLCVTLNDHDDIDPQRIIETFNYSHPVLDTAAIRAQAGYDRISGQRTHYCGAYWGSGFHEDGVVSAIRACRPFGVHL